MYTNFRALAHWKVFHKCNTCVSQSIRKTLVAYTCIVWHPGRGHPLGALGGGAKHWVTFPIYHSVWGDCLSVATKCAITSAKQPEVTLWHHCKISFSPQFISLLHWTAVGNQRQESRPVFPIWNNLDATGKRVFFFRTASCDFMHHPGLCFFLWHFSSLFHWGDLRKIRANFPTWVGKSKFS